MKNDFGDKKSTKEKIVDFVDKKGFYIILVVCVLIVGVTAYYISLGNQRSSGISYQSGDLLNDEIVENFTDATGDYSLDSIIDDVEQMDLDEDSAEESDVEQDLDQSKDQQPSDDSLEQGESVVSSEVVVIEEDTSLEEVAEVDGPELIESTLSDSEIESLALPVFGGISLDYGMDRLLYSKTLDEWRTHSGIDIESPLGTPVKAAADGVVKDIKNDPRYGVLVILDHGNGLKTVYANLAEGNVVAPNQKVKKDDVIGSVGETAIFEISEPTHLHFEVLRDNKLVDPKEFLSID